MKTCYIHIGLEKTGTTTIQKFLFENYDLLKQEGFLVPRCWQSYFGHNALAILSYNKDKKDNFVIDIGNQNKTIQSFRNEVLVELEKELLDNNINNIIFSSELIQSRLTDIEEVNNLKKLLEDMGFCKIKIIVYLREQLKLVQSLFYEAIKWDELAIKDIANFLDLELQTKERFIKKTKRDFQHICNHKQTLEWYSQVFGSDNLIVRIFEKEQWHRGNLLDDFLYNIGIERDEKYSIPQDQNKTINAIGLMILDEFNRQFPFHIDGMQKWRDWSFLEKVQESFTLDQEGQNKLHIPFEILKYFQDINLEGNYWVRDNFFSSRAVLFEDTDEKLMPPPPPIFYQQKDIQEIVDFLLRNQLRVNTGFNCEEKGLLKRIVRRLFKICHL